MTLSTLLHDLGVRQQPEAGALWNAATFAREIGVNPADLTPSRSERRRQADLALACWGARELEAGRVPEAWSLWHEDVRVLALRIARARWLAMGRPERLSDLGAMLTAWGIGGEALALDLLEQVGERLQAALEVQGWAGVCVVVREVVDG